ncbi:MAG: glycosyltransferase [Candidatus Aphodosoma sp.]
MRHLNILFITDALTEPLYGRRTRFFCSYFHRQGHTVHLITEKYKPLPFKEDYEITEIPYYRHLSGWKFKTEWAAKNALSVLFNYRNRYFARRIARTEASEHPDIIICSTFSSMGLLASARLAENMGIPFIADLRDITEQSPNNEHERPASSNSRLSGLLVSQFRKVNIRRRNKILRRADAITAVSPWTVDFLSQFNGKTRLIYNGYDSALFSFKERHNPKFQIIYMGKWYPKMQDPTPLFESLQQIKASQPDMYRDIVVSWYTDSDCTERLKSHASRHDITDCMEYNDYVPFDNVPELLRLSSVILILSDESSPHVLPTKLFEAIGVEKPALCVKCVPGALADTITNAGAGLATADVQEIIQFIASRHEEWKSNGHTHQAVRNSRFYSRSYQAEQMSGLIYELTEKP